MDVNSRISFTVIVLFFLLGCASEKQEEVIKGVKSNSFSEIIRNPVNHDGSIDTVNVAKLKFTKEVHDFGEVEEGAFVEHDFPFINAGNVGLLITEAQSTCGCTVPQYPKEIIKPGERGIIHVAFASQGRTGKQDKPITITANTYPSRTVIRLKGFVIPQNKEE